MGTSKQSLFSSSIASLWVLVSSVPARILISASELDKESEDTQLAYLRLCLDPEIRIRAGTDDAKTHKEAMDELNKLCFEVYNPAINRQIEVFRINQPKTENSTQFAQRVRTMYMHSDVASAGSDKIKCLLIIRG